MTAIVTKKPLVAALFAGAAAFVASTVYQRLDKKYPGVFSCDLPRDLEMIPRNVKAIEIVNSVEKYRTYHERAFLDIVRSLDCLLILIRVLSIPNAQVFPIDRPNAKSWILTIGLSINQIKNEIEYSKNVDALVKFKNDRKDWEEYIDALNIQIYQLTKEFTYPYENHQDIKKQEIKASQPPHSPPSPPQPPSVKQQHLHLSNHQVSPPTKQLQENKSKQAQVQTGQKSTVNLPPARAPSSLPSNRT